MLKKISAAVLLAFGLVSFNFAQNFPQNPQNQDNEDEDIENFMNEFEQNSENEEKAQKRFNPEIQRTFIFSSPSYHLDLNPHTSSYSNEAQIINALQEGLFCYDPKLWIRFRQLLPNTEFPATKNAGLLRFGTTQRQATAQK